MRPWVKNILIVAGALALIMILPQKLVRPVIGLITIGSAIWVYKDSKKLDISKYKKTALSLSTTPGGAAVVVFLLWLIALPMYISYRQRIIEGKIPLKESVS